MDNVAGINRIQNNINDYSYKDQVTNQEKDVMSNLSAGSSISGRITSMAGDTATIDVNGNQLSAKLEGSMNLREGQMVTFTVRQSSDQSVTLSPLFTNMNTEKKRLTNFR